MRTLRSIIGVIMLAVWLPILIGGLRTLRSRGRFGETDRLITTGPYARVRHPLYAGLSLSITGVGLLTGCWLLVVAGLLWLGITQVWAIHEERDLSRRFGEQYDRYRRATPGVVPRVVGAQALRNGG
jgi:protein-S-isoprenylcysteine O-methyltransferase Ste14